MSQNWYVKNMDRNEYIRSDGNGDYRSTLRDDNPKFIIWVMMDKWENNTIKCFPEHKMPSGDYADIILATNKTKEYRKEFDAFK